MTSTDAMRCTGSTMTLTLSTRPAWRWSGVRHGSQRGDAALNTERALDLYGAYPAVAIGLLRRPDRPAAQPSAPRPGTSQRARWCRARAPLPPGQRACLAENAAIETLCTVPVLAPTCPNERRHPAGSAPVSSGPTRGLESAKRSERDRRLRPRLSRHVRSSAGSRAPPADATAGSDVPPQSSDITLMSITQRSRDARRAPADLRSGCPRRRCIGRVPGWLGRSTSRRWPLTPGGNVAPSRRPHRLADQGPADASRPSAAGGPPTPPRADQAHAVDGRSQAECLA